MGLGHATLSAALRPIAIGLLTATVLTGCGSGGKDASDTSIQEPILLKSRITLRGALAVRGNYTVNFAEAGGDSECEEFAGRKSSGSSVVSLILPMPTRIGGKHLSWTAAIRPYRGPGDYAIDKVPGFRLAVLDAKGQPTDRFVASSATRAKATVAKDGSGSFTFTDLKQGTQAVSGEARWSCTAEKE